MLKLIIKKQDFSLVQDNALTLTKKIYSQSWVLRGNPYLEKDIKPSFVYSRTYAIIRAGNSPEAKAGGDH
jgi:hypothetical protein